MPQGTLNIFFLLPFVSTLNAFPTVSALDDLKTGFGVFAFFVFLTTIIGQNGFYSTFH